MIKSTDVYAVQGLEQEHEISTLLTNRTFDGKSVSIHERLGGSNYKFAITTEILKYRRI